MADSSESRRVSHTLSASFAASASTIYFAQRSLRIVFPVAPCLTRGWAYWRLRSLRQSLTPHQVRGDAVGFWRFKNVIQSTSLCLRVFVRDKKTRARHMATLCGLAQSHEATKGCCVMSEDSLATRPFVIRSTGAGASFEGGLHVQNICKDWTPACAGDHG
jgi:hypothetical protein